MVWSGVNDPISKCALTHHVLPRAANLEERPHEGDPRQVQCIARLVLRPELDKRKLVAHASVGNHIPRDVQGQVHLSQRTVQKLRRAEQVGKMNVIVIIIVIVIEWDKGLVLAVSRLLVFLQGSLASLTHLVQQNIGSPWGGVSNEKLTGYFRRSLGNDMRGWDQILGLCIGLIVIVVVGGGGGGGGVVVGEGRGGVELWGGGEVGRGGLVVKPSPLLVRFFCHSGRTKAK